MEYLQHMTFKPLDSPITIPTEILDVFPNFNSHAFPILHAQPGKAEPPSKRIGVCFSGGPAPGGHAVLYALLEAANNHHSIIGFHNGLGGLLSGDLTPLNMDDVRPYRHQGGFHLLGTERFKISTSAHFSDLRRCITEHSLDAIIIIGGDDSQTNAIQLAHATLDLPCTIVGVPKTIDGDLRYPPYLPISFGFHSACDLYSQLVTNLIRDTQSTRKYWHIVKLMGRHASHIAQEVGRQTQADLTLIGEHLHQKNTGLDAVIKTLASHIKQSAASNKDYGVILLPEGLLNWLHVRPDTLPPELHKQLTQHVDPHGNSLLSQVATEQVIIDMLHRYFHEHHPDFIFNAMTQTSYEGSGFS